MKADAIYSGIRKAITGGIAVSIYYWVAYRWLGMPPEVVGFIVLIDIYFCIGYDHPEKGKVALSQAMRPIRNCPAAGDPEFKDCLVLTPEKLIVIRRNLNYLRNTHGSDGRRTRIVEWIEELCSLLNA